MKRRKLNQHQFNQEQFNKIFDEIVKLRAEFDEYIPAQNIITKYFQLQRNIQDFCENNLPINSALRKYLQKAIDSNAESEGKDALEKSYKNLAIAVFSVEAYISQPQTENFQRDALLLQALKKTIITKNEAIKEIYDSVIIPFKKSKIYSEEQKHHLTESENFLKPEAASKKRFDDLVKDIENLLINTDYRTNSLTDQSTLLYKRLKSLAKQRSIRKNQKELITAVFNHLKNHQTMSSDERTERLFGMLDEINQQIKAEKNIFASSLSKTIEHILKKNNKMIKNNYRSSFFKMLDTNTDLKKKASEAKITINQSSFR